MQKIRVVKFNLATMKLWNIIHLIFISSCFSSYAQETFDWYEGKCLFTGKIDTTKASYGEVTNAYYVLINPNEMNSPYLAYNPKDTVYLNVSAIEKESKSYVDEINAMIFPKSAYWQNLREQKLNEIKALADLRKMTVIALKNPKILKKSTYYKSSKDVCNALISGGDELLNAWKELQAQQYAEAYDQEAVKNAFQVMWDSPNRELYARMELLRYVFYNQALQQINFVDINTAVLLNFKNLMTGVTSDCH